MYRNKKMKKGFVLVYTLLITSFCLIIAVYIFTLQVKISKNVNSYKNYVLKEQDYDKYKEYLFTELNEQILKNINKLEREEIKSYLNRSSFSNKSEDNKAKIKYNSIADNIEFTTYYETNYIRIDRYSYNTSDGKLKLIYLDTLYSEGKVE
ncbi:hypothetical protein JK636_19625 [Clostridium sp. YIM B02515]|uniref:Uncharacterized protein n=1 Tax=Clostridium rhizosphaerae TaxID=2803861 RepID=A0ABS1TEY0_9CLOT|nr:hypothetical protein [Clostridium rhizosphaerae]MBL4937923.1 hypothetical protein [Clostridium rhizosphaerae]